MFCKSCKKEIDDDSKFCEFCRAKIEIINNVPAKTLESKKSDKNLESLKSKPLYRFLKVVYLILFITAIVFLTIKIDFGATTGHEIKQGIDYKKSLIICDNGKEYSISKFNDIENAVSFVDDVVTRHTYPEKYNDWSHFKFTHSPDAIKILDDSVKSMTNYLGVNNNSGKIGQKLGELSGIKINLGKIIKIKEICLTGTTSLKNDIDSYNKIPINFKIDFVYKDLWGKFFKFWFTAMSLYVLGLICIVIFFEIIKQLFYYIFLGKFYLHPRILRLFKKR